MSVGDAIFLSAALLAIVGLYAATKDRWKWRRLAKWFVAVPVALVLVLGVGLWGAKVYQDRPTKQVEFGSVKLGESTAEVRFRRGEPSKKEDADTWQYDESTSSLSDGGAYVVTFKKGKVETVRYFSSKTYGPSLLGFSKGSHYDDVVAKLGPPSHVATSKDGLRRMLSFDSYNVTYGFEQAKVEVYGLYDPGYGPMRFAEDTPGTPSSVSAVSR